MAAGPLLLRYMPSLQPSKPPLPTIVHGSAPAVVGIPSSISPSQVTAFDGDTVSVHGRTVRLVGFDTPETGNRARCDRERDLAARATRRLREIIGGGGFDFRSTFAQCRAHAGRAPRERTPATMVGACGELRSHGRDVGAMLIGEGLARPYRCTGQSCPPRGNWCG
jgi:endonuclease YncB( thermonuclease family)